MMGKDYGIHSYEAVVRKGLGNGQILQSQGNDYNWVGFSFVNHTYFLVVWHAHSLAYHNTTILSLYRVVCKLGEAHGYIVPEESDI